MGTAFLATVGSGLGIWSSHLERMSHFRLWWIGLLLGLALYFGIARRARFCRLSLIIAAGALIPLIPYWKPAKEPAPSPGNEVLLISWNVLHENPADRQAALRWLTSQNADLVLLTECTVAWRELLAPLHEIYPHRISSERDGAEGMLLLSRYPLDPPDPVGLVLPKPWISTVAHLPGGAVRVIGMHPRTPRSGERFDQRNVQYEQAAAISRDSKIPVILMGDLNCTPFSPWFRRLVKQGGLRDSALGHGFPSTWRGQGIGLPIDHILLSYDWQVLSRWVHADRMGSDHHPVMAKIRRHPLD